MFVFRGVQNRKFCPQRPGTDLPRPGKQMRSTPHKEGIGFSIELKAFPIDGRLVVLPPDTDDGNSRNGK
jgi:hypothetical protein